MKTIKHSVRNSAAIFVITGLILLMFSGCTESNNDPNGPGGQQSVNEVFIKGSSFTPVTLAVTAGTTVTWTNKDGLTHTVTSDTGVFTSPGIASNGTFSFTFTSAGTYPYHCTIHPAMTASVIVN